MKDRAYAKINLSLDVVSRREDGYHELNMIMLPITFYDMVEVRFADDMDFKSNVKYIPKTPEGNTMLKAVELLKQKYGFKQNFSIEVTKHIPTRAGLGGGSADAASVIRIINRMMNLKMTLEEKLEIAKQVGADVPFCIENKPSLVKGIGEKIEEIKVNCPFWILLVKPRAGVSTKKAFTELDLSLCDHPDCDLIKEALENNDYESICHNIGNSLEQSSMKITPVIKEIKDDLIEYGCDASLMSGSGSTVFGISRSESKIDIVNKIMKDKGYFVRKVKILE